jgi:hypothetical protein
MKLQSLERGETKDCAVISMALILGIPYNKSHAMFAKCGRLFRTGTWVNKVNGVLHEFGVKHKRYNQFEIDEMAKKVGLKDITFKTVSPILKTGKKYLMISRKHSAAIIDRKIVDWAEGTDRKVIGLVEIL